VKWRRITFSAVGADLDLYEQLPSIRSRLTKSLFVTSLWHAMIGGND
jgi:hypothetical protein